MAAEQEIRASMEEIEGFVAKLKEFHGSLKETEQAMLATIWAPSSATTSRTVSRSTTTARARGQGFEIKE